MNASNARQMLACAALFTLTSAITACGEGAAEAPAGRDPDRELSSALAAADSASPGWSSLGTLVQRAERGLAISPVPLPARATRGPQRLLVGLGSYVVNAASDCAACHSTPAGFLSGGNPFFLDGQGHVVWTRNLTPDASTGLKLTLPQFLEAIRTGRDFHPGATRMLVVMPWTTLRWASDLDLVAIYAYLRSIPPVANAVPPDNKDLPLPPSVPFPGNRYTDGDVDRPLSGELTSFDPLRGREISPLAQPPLSSHDRQRYGTGSYIANALTHCNDCHTHPDRTPDFSKVNTGAFLTGGTVFAVPPPLAPVFRQVRTMSANLKGKVNGFLSEPTDSYRRFRDIIVTGTHADETPPRPLGFPMVLVAANLKNLLDEDLRAVYTFVKLSPATTGAADQPRQPYARWCASGGDCHTGETCAAATSECVGGACSDDIDCGACQTCGGGHCQAPATDSACLASAQ